LSNTGTRRRKQHLLGWPKSCPTEVLSHSGDIRIPLGLPFEPDSQLTATALDFLTGPVSLGLVPWGRLRGLRLHATDINRAWGKGQEIRGKAAELMMAAVGRTATLDTLDGPGVPLLRQRISDPKTGTSKGRMPCATNGYPRRAVVSATERTWLFS
jgi:hypothetical protein